MDNNSKKSSLLNYPQNIEEKLGFDKIREFIQAEWVTGTRLQAKAGNTEDVDISN